MKKHILFVDDEPNVLKSLQRSLRHMRTDWDMDFAEGSLNALSVLENKAYDVVISDMQMPGLDGAKFMKSVQEKCPQAIRIILSGHSDQEKALKTMKSAHQYLSKPCEKETLIAAITRACTLKNILNHRPLQDLLGKTETLPSAPPLYMKIMAALRSEASSIAEVSEIIASDLGMTARILSLVNSPFYGGSRRFTSVKEAVFVLGMDVIRILVLSVEAFSNAGRAATVISLDKIHNHCVRTGGIAFQLAGLEKMDKKTSENAAISGILHDIGKLLLAEYFTLDYKKALGLAKNKEISVFKAEKEIFGVTHAEAGAYLMGLWGLPEQIVQGIAFHHSPQSCDAETFESCGIVHVSDLMDHHDEHHPQGWDQLEGLDEAYMEKIGLLSRVPLWRDYLRSTASA